MEMVDASQKKAVSESFLLNLYVTFCDFVLFWLIVVNVQPKTPSTPQSSGQKTLFVGNLSFSVEQADVYVLLPSPSCTDHLC